MTTKRKVFVFSNFDQMNKSMWKTVRNDRLEVHIPTTLGTSHKFLSMVLNKRHLTAGIL